jgi:NSS family neurotransmitter:Na+ symporter
MVASSSGSARDGWSSRTAFILAAIGSAVGLGNLWRFPAEAGANGGGAFVLFYILCVILIGLPVLLSETLIGRHGQASAPESVRRMAVESGASTHWDVLAGLGVLSAFMIVSFYCVVGGWVLYYIGVFANDIVQTGVVGGAFAGRPPEDIEALLPGLFGNGALMAGLGLGFLAITLFFVMRGVSKGIEWVATWLMPAFFVLLIAITGYGFVTGEASETIAYLFTFDFSKLTPQVMLAAVGQAFFSLSLGVAGMITYGAYAGRDVNLGQTSAIVGGADTAVALIAGLCIFPIVFAAGLSVTAGPGLMFQSLPVAFQNMPVGSVIGFAFFMMVGFAALTSSVALLEVPTSWVMERFNISRVISALIVGFGAAVLGVLAALSFNDLADVRPLSMIPIFAEANVFDALDGVTAKIFMPLGAILTCLFVGWVADPVLVDGENGIDGWLHHTWRFLVRLACPTVLAVIMVFGLFG